MGVYVTPTQDHVLVKIAPPASVSKGGIVLPKPKVADARKGFVAAKGPGRWLEDGTRLSPDVSVGELVYFRPTAGKDVRDGDDWYVMLRESDILMAVGYSDAS